MGLLLLIFGDFLLRSTHRYEPLAEAGSSVTLPLKALDPTEYAILKSRLLRDPCLYAAAAFALIVCGPIYRYLGSLGDEGLLLHGAIRILHGEVIYRDFFEVVPPGGFLIVTTWMTIFGEDFGSTRVLAVGMIAVISALSYAAATLASRRRLLPLVLAMAWAVRVPLENNHHWFTTAASLAAAVCVFLALDDSSARLGIAFSCARQEIPGIHDEVAARSLIIHYCRQC